MRINNYNSGFTLLETIIALTIVSTFTVMGVVGYRSFERPFQVISAAKELVTVLEEAREKTIAAELSSDNARQWGVYIDTSAYTLFSGTAYSATAASNVVHTIPSNVEVYSGTGSSFLFDRLTGNTSNAGDIALRHTADNTITRTVRVHPSGQSGLVSTHTPTGTARTYDNRHVHYTLTWGIANADNLILKFGDNPLSPEHTETVPMTDYFDNPTNPTVFNWEGTVTVGSEEQTIRVHTHDLQISDTILSIVREGSNTKGVTVYIDDSSIEKEIVQYTAGGVPTYNTTWVTTMTEQ